MDYDLVVEKLRRKFETLQQENAQLRDEMTVLSNENYILKVENMKFETLQQENAQLRDEMAVLSNEDYMLKVGNMLAASEAEKNQAELRRLAELEQQLIQLQQELKFIQGSNVYKIWMKYRRIPKPIRKVFHGIFALIEIIYKGIKKVFK